MPHLLAYIIISIESPCYNPLLLESKREVASQNEKKSLLRFLTLLRHSFCKAIHLALHSIHSIHKKKFN